MNVIVKGVETSIGPAVGFAPTPIAYCRQALGSHTLGLLLLSDLTYGQAEFL
jgi:hypothetical protein